jgi:hypothetical protein
VPEKVVWLLASSVGVMGFLALYVGLPVLIEWWERRFVDREIKALTKEAGDLRAMIDGD